MSQATEANSMKPCPFCGELDSIAVVDSAVVCECGAAFRDYTGEKAARAWNCRAADELDRLREDRDAFRASSEIRGEEIERLRARIALLEPVAAAARVYYLHYMQDEADDDGELWCGSNQHEAAKAVKDALDAALSKDGAP